MPFGRTGALPPIDELRPKCTHCGKAGAQFRAVVQDATSDAMTVELLRYCSDRGISAYVEVVLYRYWCNATCHANWGTNQEARRK